MKKQGKIIVIPLSGLANRLRVIVTTIKLSKQSNKQLHIYWDNNNALNAVYNDLFEPLKNVIIKKPPFKYKLWLKMKSLSLRLEKLSAFYLRLFGFDFVFLDNMASLVWHNKINLQEEINNASKVFMATCQELNYFDLEDYQMFLPKPELQVKIDVISKKFSSNTIGIHIRSTDNEVSLINSPFNVFIEKIREEIKHDDNVQFFLATDNKDYQEKLMELFGEKIFFNEKEFSRNKSEGIKDAVVDLFCLSRTSKIYGSYFSSFSYVPGRIGNIPCEVVKV